MPLTRTTLHEALWMLPAAIVYQLQLIHLQAQGYSLVINKGTDPRILERLKKARAQRG